MPALIKAEDFDAWLDSDRVRAQDAARLLKPVDDDYLAADPADLSRPRRETQAPAAARSRPAQAPLISPSMSLWPMDMTLFTS